MKYSFIKPFFHVGVFLAPAFLLTGCIVDDYNDLDNIDLTVGLGGDGLGVTLGNTEKIMLGDILSVDESVKLDDNNLYYLVENGSTDFKVNIKPIVVKLDIPALTMKMNVLEYDAVRQQFMEAFPGIPVPDGQPIPIIKNSEKEFVPTGLADSKKEEMKFTVSEIANDVKKINWVSFDESEVTLKLHQDKSDNVKFGLKELKNVVITLPEQLHVSDYPKGIWKYSEENHTLIQRENAKLVLQGTDLEICKVKVDRADVNEEVKNDEFTVTSDITMTGDVDFYVTEDFNMTPGDYVTIELEFVHVDGLSIQEVNGRFNPVVNPDLTRVDIAENLPDFLKDDDVTVSVTNPTLKFTSDLQDIPIGFTFGADLTAVKEAGPDEAGRETLIELPQVTINSGENTTIYYHQGEAPYDPEGVEEKGPNVVWSQVENLSDLIEKLPDYVEVDLQGGKISVLENDYTIKMGSDYNAQAMYDIYVPFEFDKGLTIVYKDSTNSFGSDLEDYAAHGLRVSAKVQNTIPLGLNLTIKAVDADGKPLPGISFTPLAVAPGTGDINAPVEKAVSIEGKLDNPNDLGKIDHLVFDIKGDASQNGQNVRQLMSTQYIRLTDISIHLTGQVIADFN